MVFGLQSVKDIKLSNVARALDEPIALKKTEERLSRNLKAEGMAGKLNEIIANEGASRTGKDTLIIVDPTDIPKEYAEKMPYLATIHDGSSGELATGYSGCMAVACERSGRLKFVCSDMWRPYLKVIAKKVPHVLHVLDRFHIVQHLNKAVNQVRIDEVKKLKQDGYDVEVLRHTKYCFLKNPKNPTDRQQTKLGDMLEYDLKSVRANSRKTSSCSGATQVRTGRNGTLKNGAPERCGYGLIPSRSSLKRSVGTSR